MVNTADCGSVTRGFDSHQSPHLKDASHSEVNHLSDWGVAKSVRHGTLTPACVGSSPAAPANDSLAQSVEHLTFNQGVRGSNPR